MALFRLVAKLGIDSTEFNAGLKKAEGSVSSSMAAIGSKVASAFSVAAIAAWVKEVANAAGKIGDLADQLNITTAEVQALQKAADHSGVSLDKYAAILGKIRKLKADYAAGDAGAAKTFQRTGINPNSSEFSILQQVGQLPDAQAFEILDSKSAKLKKSIQELSMLDPIEMVDDKSIKKLDEAGDKLGDLWRIIQAISARMLSGEMAGKSPLQIGADLAGQTATKRIIDSLANGSDAQGPIPPHQEFPTRTGMPAGFTMSGRSSEMVGPMPRMRGQFSAIDMGDRANVGGFFGPNADLNRSMQRTLASMDQSLKTIEKSVAATMNTP